MISFVNLVLGVSSFVFGVPCLVFSVQNSMFYSGSLALIAYGILTMVHGVTIKH